MEKRKNTMMRAAGCMLMLGLLSTCAISGTFAKYTDTTTGTGSARVAKWDVTASDWTSDKTTDTFTFSLFDTLIDTNDSTETDVVSANSDKVIAPGTKGEFQLVLDNESEVSATYAIDYEVSNTAGIPVEFSVDGKAWDAADKVWTSTLTDVAATAITEETTITIQWRWIFNGDDAEDTAFGVKGTDTITVSAAVTFTQVD